MNISELLKRNKKILLVLKENNIRINDVRMLDIKSDYDAMVCNGAKRSYIISQLARKYKCCERTIYSTIRKLSKKVKYEY